MCFEKNTKLFVQDGVVMSRVNNYHSKSSIKPQDQILFYYRFSLDCWTLSFMWTAI